MSKEEIRKDMADDSEGIGNILGEYVYEFDAPTNRIISICLFLLFIVIFIVLLIRNAVTTTSPITIMNVTFFTTSNILTSCSTIPSPARTI